MATEIYQPTDRRPIAARERPIWQKAASALAAADVSANAISIFGMVVGIAAGAALVATSFPANTTAERMLWLASAAGIQLRLVANMLDGMVAIARQETSPLGELYNELPDRVSDIAIIIGAGYSTGSWPILGYLAACVAVLTAYIRAVGKAAGASDLFVGPMAKPHRMFTLTVVSIAMAVLPAAWKLSWEPYHVSWPSVGLALIIVGGVVTIYRRLSRIVRHLKGRH
jgi:phosphatidylglycerophosphate synthase